MTRSALVILPLALAVAACSRGTDQSATGPTSTQVAQAPATNASGRNFTAHLSGAAEVPAVDTRAAGQAVLHVGDAGIDYKLIVSNLEGVTQAHIHCGTPGVNGPVVAFLFGFVPAGVAVNGILAQGTVVPAGVIPRPDSAACPGGVAGFDDLVAKIRSGGAYVNVHTLAVPSGEIRGQIR